MIYLTNGNMPLNAAYADEIVQEDNSTYQLTFRFPTSDLLWEKLKEETFLTADDLHGEQDFVIFEVEKKHGYIQVYAKQVFTLLNNYVVSSLTLDRATGSTALSRFAGAITRDNPFSFFSDIEDRHTFNIGSKNAMEAFAKDKHSIIGQWGGDLVRHGYQVRLLKNGGSENESLFMYKKNLSSYQHKTSTKSLKTRITFIATVKGEGEKAPDRKLSVVVDSPLINKYSQIYEDVIEVNDRDVKDEASLRKYGEQYYRTSLCDMMEDSLELEVVGQSDVPVQMFDIVSLFHDVYNLDVRKKITKYTYSPMGKKLKTIGFGQFKLGLANAIGNVVSDAVKGEAQQLQSDFERQLARELKNADLAFDRKTEELKNEFEDGLNATRAKAEEVKQELSDNINQHFNSFNNGPLQEAKRRAEEALRNAGASTLLAQEAKRIGLDSVAKLEEFKRQATSAQTALSGDLDALKRTVANDIRPKQAQAEAEIAKQVEALIQTKNELAGVKSAQATYEETTTRRLSELTNLANGKASKSELMQTAEELASRIASVRVGGKNYYRDSEKVRTSTRFFSFPLHLYLSQENIGETWTLSFDLKINEGGEIRPLHFYHYQTNRFGLKASADITPSKDWQRFTFTGPVIFPNDDPRYSRGEMALYDYAGNNNYSVRRIKLEKGTLATDWSPALEDIEGQLSTVESNFRQRADSLDAGVRSLTEGLRTKADISTLNVTAENIRQSVKSLETDTQNKLNQKLSMAEFEVQAGSIRQEILNATKDKADKTLVVAEAGKLREEFSNLRVGGRNYYRDSEKIRTSTRFFSFPLHPYLTQENVGETWTLSFDLKINEGGEIRPLHFYHYQTNRFGLKASADITPSKEWQRFTFTGPVIFPNDDPRYSRGEMALYDYGGNNNYSVRRIKLEKGTLATDWSPALEDTYGLITEAKATFERTAQGLRTDLSAIQEYVNKDGQRQEALQRYTREESAKQATAVRELVEKDYVGKATYQETVKAIEHKFEAITNPQNGSIATQIATYKNAVDGRFADITSLIAGKANQTDFQRVKETSQLYERIIGSNENDISNKVARMAMTNQLFQVEVGKAFAEHQNLFLTSTLTKGFLGNNGIISVANATQKEVTSDFISVNPNEKIIFQHWVTLPENGMAWTAWQFFDKNKNPIDNRKPGLNAYKTTVGKQHNINQITVPANAYFVRFSARMYDDGLIKVEKGSTPSDYSVAPNDALEAVKTVQTQLAGSWAVQNINSAGDIISGINLGANGHNRFDGKLTHITGETLIDKAVIKSAMIDKLKTANFEAGSVTTAILDAEAVTAEKIKVDQAFFNKFVANEAYLKQLFAKQAFINRVQSVAIDASQVSSGVLSGDRIYGGTIRGSNIYGGTLTGHTQIQLGSYGSFDTVNGGLQINVPRNYNAKDGLGVQFIGSYGRGENVPYGLFVYKDSDFTRGNTATPTTEFLLTVEGYIKANGIGWMRTGKGSINGGTTATIGFWNSNNVSLDFGGSGNDIYYSYNGKAYSLWTCVNAHFSDRRLKENIVDCKHKALDYIHQFQFKEYDWKKQEDRQKQAHTKIGLIAQEVQVVDPTLVYENGDTLNLDNLRLTNIALKAIQELALENRKLTHRLEKLENEYRTA
ncbi:TPA: phage tail spike protein [Streptococcus pneumoniae]